MAHDYSLYLVTDSTDALLRGRDLVSVVQKAIEGGVSIVQYRDKLSDTKVLISTARKLHAVTRSHGVPLLINDRIDVALAIEAEGVHIGQDDMDLDTARKLLGPAATIGVTCHSVEEARRAILGGADYLGIGTLFVTSTKVDATNLIGTAGCRDILNFMATVQDRPRVSAVAIGGINASNIQRVIFQTAVPSRSLDGVAVVSAIIGTEHPDTAARNFRELLSKPSPFGNHGRLLSSKAGIQKLMHAIPDVTRAVGEVAPLCHNMTNLVVQNFAANVVLAIGAKPIMSLDGSEAEDLSTLGGSLVINMGTANADTMQHYLRALVAYNQHGGPVVLDPVGAGATQLRRQAVKQLLAGGYFDVIKGNESEIQVVLGTSLKQQRGVDSSSDLTIDDKARLVKQLASRERNIVVMTGETDFVSDGERTFAIKNGSPLLGIVTGTGCTLGATIASYIAAMRDEKLVATIAALLHFEIAAERAAAQTNVMGPGSFVAAFIDRLKELACATASNDHNWLTEAKITVIE